MFHAWIKMKGFACAEDVMLHLCDRAAEWIAENERMRRACRSSIIMQVCSRVRLAGRICTSGCRQIYYLRRLHVYESHTLSNSFIPRVACLIQEKSLKTCKKTGVSWQQKHTYAYLISACVHAFLTKHTYADVCVPEMRYIQLTCVCM